MNLIRNKNGTGWIDSDIEPSGRYITTNTTEQKIYSNEPLCSLTYMVDTNNKMGILQYPTQCEWRKEKSRYQCQRLFKFGDASVVISINADNGTAYELMNQIKMKLGFKCEGENKQC